MSAFSESEQDALTAVVDLVGRTGAKDFEIGWVNEEGEPAFGEKGPQWYAYAQYKGTRLTAEDHNHPIPACEELARKLLTGARCTCGKLVALSDEGAVAYDDVTMADGSKWTAAEAAAAGQCRWRRVGPRWVSACGLTGQPQGPSRAERRKKR